MEGGGPTWIQICWVTFLLVMFGHVLWGGGGQLTLVQTIWRVFLLDFWYFVNRGGGLVPSPNILRSVSLLNQLPVAMTVCHPLMQTLLHGGLETSAQRPCLYWVTRRLFFQSLVKYILRFDIFHVFWSWQTSLQCLVGELALQRVCGCGCWG